MNKKVLLSGNEDFFLRKGCFRWKDNKIEFAEPFPRLPKFKGELTKKSNQELRTTLETLDNKINPILSEKVVKMIHKH